MQDGMFYRVTDFAFARNAKQAVGFYLFHLLIGAVGFMLAVLVYKLVFGLPEDADIAQLLGIPATLLSMGYVAFLNFRLLQSKGLLHRFHLWPLALLGVGVSVLGMLLGLLSAACLSILHPAAVAARDGAVNEEE